jgi:very-short-patch-repair endonuclease
MWTLLRNRRLGGLKIRRQHPVGPYVLDFYCPKLRLAIELDGSGHAVDSRRVRDKARGEVIGGLQIRIVRFWNNELVKSETAVLERIIEIADEITAESAG